MEKVVHLGLVAKVLLEVRLELGLQYRGGGRHPRRRRIPRAVLVHEIDRLQPSGIDDAMEEALDRVALDVLTAL